MNMQKPDGKKNSRAPLRKVAVDAFTLYNRDNLLLWVVFPISGNLMN